MLYIYLVFINAPLFPTVLSRLAGVQTGGIILTHCLHRLSFVGLDCPHHYHNTHFFFLSACLFLSCVYIYTGISRWQRGGVWVGVRGFAPALPSSAHWLSGLSESDSTLMTGHHLPQQQQGEANIPTQNPPPNTHLSSPLPVSPTFLFMHRFLFFWNHEDPPPTDTHTQPHLVHTGVFEPCFSHCFLTRLW